MSKRRAFGQAGVAAWVMVVSHVAAAAEPAARASAMAERNAAEAARAAPYRKLLKNDKLAIALRDTAYLLLPDGARVTPARLAEASVWFEDTMPEQLCRNGTPLHTLWRFAFDAEHRLVQRTHKDYCGHPPDAAWR